MVKRLKRRTFLFLSGIAVMGALFVRKMLPWELVDGNNGEFAFPMNGTGENIGVEKDGNSYLYLAKNGSPEENTRKVIEMMGGIQSIIGARDVVILKPNAQWWNQGMTNTDSMKVFIEMIIEMPNFDGEIIIAENHHYPENNSRGWTTEERNGEYNYNELVEYFHSLGHYNVSKYHWHDGGRSYPSNYAEGGRVVESPEEGDGYVWRYALEHVAPHGRKTIMSYPIFTSSYSGRRVDLKNGIWENGHYTDIPIKFINFSALNHHEQTGVTASIKNYLGVCDMTCGLRGKEPEGYWNFHNIGFANINWRVKSILRRFGWRDTGEYIGGVVGTFMKTVLMADLNIITAEWVGWGGRTDINKRAHARTVIVSRDPVALDYYSSKYVLLPATPKTGELTHYAKWNNPDYANGPFRKFLEDCHKQGVGNLDERFIVTKTFDSMVNS